MIPNVPFNEEEWEPDHDSLVSRRRIRRRRRSKLFRCCCCCVSGRNDRQHSSTTLKAFTFLVTILPLVANVIALQSQSKFSPVSSTCTRFSGSTVTTKLHMATQQGSSGYSLGLSPYIQPNKHKQYQREGPTKSSKTKHVSLQKFDNKHPKTEAHHGNSLINNMSHVFVNFTLTQTNNTFNSTLNVENDSQQAGPFSSFPTASENRTIASKHAINDFDQNKTLGNKNETAFGSSSNTTLGKNQIEKVRGNSSPQTTPATNKTTSSKEGNNSSPFPWVHMDPSSYFQFQLYQPKMASSTSKSSKGKPSSSPSDTKKGAGASSSFVNELQTMLENRSPDDLLTVQDLQSILSLDEERISPKAKSSPLDPTLRPRTSNIRPGMIEASLDEEEKRKKSKKLTAFPQPSVLSAKSIQKGITVAGGLVGMLLGMSILPNLWLIGALAGGFYGYDLGKREHQQEDSSNRNVFANIIMMLGTKLAKKYLQFYDAFITLFFMYKTGQLSYQYYQQYARLDERFAIQNKIDAWNARFAEGKIAFDRWEKENEVGRKVLAGLRTMWLVEERSLKKARLLRRSRRTSKYRLVQVLYDVIYWVGRVTGQVFQTLIGRGDGSLKEFLQGLIKWDLSQSSISARIGAALVLVVVVNFVGVLFSSSPTMLSILALAIGMVYPSWLSHTVDQLNDVWEDTRARGRGDDREAQPETMSSSTSNAPSTRTFSFSLPSWEWATESKEKFVSQRRRKRIDKTRYHYYYTKDGKRRYYRVGIPWFKSGNSSKDTVSSFRWPWQSDSPSSSKPQPGWWI